MVVAVTIVTVLTDLAIAVVAGVIIGALFFAWEQAKQITANITTDKFGLKVYERHGSLFFASTANLTSLFTPNDDPKKIVVEFKNARAVDHSALEAIESLVQRYEGLGKRVIFRRLSPECQELIRRSRSKSVVNPAEDPTYHIADDRIS